jgi:hypothetical protein
MAHVLLETEQARFAVINAAAAEGRTTAPASARCPPPSRHRPRGHALVAEESIQMHGGTGITRELALAHCAKQPIMIDHQLGDEDHRLARFVDLS